MQTPDTQHHSPHQPQPMDSRPYKLKPPSIHRTSPITWFTAIFCAILWTIIILGGLAVLIVYLVFRPKSPRFEISSITLNSAYLDTGTLLNADFTLLANFSNPNHKVDVSFSYLEVDLYFKGTLIGTQAIDPFTERAGESALRSVHLVSSEVGLSEGQAEEWKKEVGGEGVELEVMGSFRTRSDLGSFLHFDYWLYGHCSFVVSAPPTGVLLSSKCRTKR